MLVKDTRFTRPVGRSPLRLMSLFRGDIFLTKLQGKTSVSIRQTPGLLLKWEPRVSLGL